ncbi:MULTISPECIES: DUF6622 family protein [Burkholderia]|uniref:Uncharacterized protein n=2 Tax=Burkholderia humptydooensis TaxID=430531 RepID=A0A7U4PA77_9BURK|nr:MULTISPECIES: DUF6622 family protein [Burkholderia]AGK50146.1 putative membrane protein [Burkholderia thailandensis MSMB121]ATF32805.1 hypothetical protein CO709_05050 [Burkholderia thailandensis]AJY39629.1 putative membrane protein [Burkholderia sp. 2002721687]ALX45825.1 hypothetical protein AQ610_25720 [Burkholderia humptydooensis]EIP86808.1 hypothetical protein A33K_16411 [Burkholderia humptydooensis MSMB43]
MYPTFHLPSYVYVLFCALVYIGVKRCFPRQVTPTRPLLSPIVFAMLGITSLNALFPHAGIGADAVALASLAAGAVLGWLHARRWRLQFNVAQSRLVVRLPGDASLLATLMLTFAAETYMHYAIAAAKPWAATSTFVLLSFAVWGLLVGMPLGRAINVAARCVRYANGPRDKDGAYTFDSN